MCGFLGLISAAGKNISREIVSTGMQYLAHRGPDDQGQQISDNWALGHQRLAIFDASAAGRQPFHRDGCYLVFNGAIYNFRQLRTQLSSLGHSFSTETDSEVVLAAYLEWGKDCPFRFNGMWAFAIVDTRQQILFCSRDRFGIKPFYYCRTPSIPFAFASEIKAFQALPDWQAHLNYQRGFEYLAYGWQDHTSQTLFAEVQQLAAGHNLIFDFKFKQTKIERYFHLSKIPRWKESELSLSEAAQQLSKLLSSSTEMRLEADVPVGLTLSGGLDSSSIAGLSRTIIGEQVPIHSFSVCFPGKDIDETDYIRAVARQHNLCMHHYQTRATDCWTDYSQTLWHQDEPFSSAAVMAHFGLMREARKMGYKVLLNGQGADEILAGYVRFYGPYLRGMSWPQRLIAGGQLLLHGGLDLTRLRHFFFPVAARVPLFSTGWRACEDQLFRRSPEQDLRQCSENLLGEVGFPVMLHYEDRNAMAHGIEMRTPFLDHRLVAFALALPASYKIRHAQRKYLLRRAMWKLLPPKVRRRKRKIGFATPQNDWMDAEQSQLTAKLHLAACQWPRLFTAELGPWAAAVLHKKQYRYYPTIWRMFSFVRWLETFRVKTD
ncbi:MAG: asparagine synthase (glutamine-hydrolyzing) [Bacteroidetes bacterium]|nr:MAG: asparagine synthase (glutamine-hydrolyzing) [Bacteroidota bacterium]